MKKIKKNIGAFLAVFMVLSFVGCSKNNALIKAFEKSEGLNSYAFKGNAEIKFDGFKLEGSDLEENTDRLQAMAISTFKYTLDGKVQQEKNKWSKSQFNVKFNMPIFQMDMNVFVETARNKDEVDYKMYMQIPENLKEQEREKLANAEYIYLDSAEIKKMSKDPQQSQLLETDLTSLANNMSSIQESFNEFVKQYTKETGQEIITSKGETEVEINGKKGNVESYEIKISKEDFNKFLEACMKDGKKANALQTLLSGMTIQQGSLGNDISKASDLIGKDGLAMTYSVKDGYVVQQKINMSIIIERQEFKYNILFDIFDINEDIKIEMPNKEEVKVIDFMEFTNIVSGPNE